MRPVAVGAVIVKDPEPVDELDEAVIVAVVFAETASVVTARKGKAAKKRRRDASSTASGESKRGESKLSSRNPLRKSRSMSLKG